ncbi:ATP-dependent Clp protease adapter ClpS [Propioniciclava soli]|uniref:ATP-dependent Clp protease adapter ClpS n=1 Tax=Propioniciclava soli TaxID=2775081 RepID=UPI001E39A922|nr:ATP-dependent Clp protease adapter ClpS [Propioniciclava soli]
MSSPEVPVTPAGGTAVAERPAEVTADLTGWNTLVWDDPINLMSYVTHVFVTYFKFSHAKATRLMMQVHTEGRSVVATGTREEMETHVNALHAYGLWATVERSE